MRRYKLSLLLVSCLLFLSLRGAAQEAADFTFRHLGQANGLRSQRIYSIVQTDDGAVWWSTKSDVERYNGVSIRHYLPGDQSLYSDFAGKSIKLRVFSYTENGRLDRRLLAFDNKGRIFVFDELHDNFRQHADIRDLTKDHLNLNDILMTRQGLWLATNTGIYFLHEDQLTPVVKDVHANHIIQTDRSLLFCTRQGVLEYALSSSSPSLSTPMSTIVDCDVESGYYDPTYNRVWLGGYSSGVSIISYDKTGKITGCKQAVSDVAIKHNPIRSFCPLNEKTMLIGIDGLGVYKVNRQPLPSGQYVCHPLFNANEGACGVLHGNGIYALLHDVWDNIFICSYSGGIDIARPVGTTIAIFQHLRNNQQSIINDRVNSIEPYQDEMLMMGTDDGVSIYNQLTKTWYHTCRGTVVLDLCKTPQGTMLAATYGKGVLEILGNGNYRPLCTKANGILDDDHVYKLYFDKEGSLWMGCLDGSLVQKTATVCKYYPIHYVKDILQLPDGQMAIATSDGIRLIDPMTGKIGELNYAPEQDEDVNRYVHTMYLNGQKELWIGTDGGGIYIYDLNTKHSLHLTQKDGLTSNFVSSISKDAFGRIIIATDNGLAFTHPDKPNRVIGVNYCYGVDREYTSRSVVHLKNGHIILGSTTGAVIIDPLHVQEINYTTLLNLLGVSCADDDDEQFAQRMHQELARRELYLSYRQRTFELFYESINLRNQSDIVYQYKVGNGEWSMPTDQQQVRFNNMEPGKHVLTVRSVSRTCGAVLDETTLTIHIGQPWWKTWWMQIIYLFLLFLAFYAAWHVYQLHTKYMRLVVGNLQDNRRFEDSREAEERHDDEGNLVTPSPRTFVPPQDLTSIPPEDLPPVTPESNASGSEFISRATKIVVDHISDANFNIDRLCREMAMSRTLFYVKLKSYTGESPQDFIRIIRLERAASLLRNGRSVTDAAALSGFDNPKYFSTVFKKYFGVSPSKYQ